MRIILVGQGPFGEKVLEALIKQSDEIVGVFSPPDKRGEVMKNSAEKSKLSLYRLALTKDPEVHRICVPPWETSSPAWTCSKPRSRKRTKV